ncbi:MAG TPA: aminotransferase class I/II-fold pyridoxal phosphate-dependent enzyme, partial [Solirubrobacteraceae bacterium]|nr:aminotransferase class I/II-fold pyridoxal phosphate-dependent enzyme [Solirubrobacteraceae bacterium]
SGWPSYPLFPIMARRAHGQAVRVEGGVDGLLEAAREPGTRAIAIASPNDPTGELLGTGELERLLNGLAEDVGVLLDESLVEFSDAQPIDSSLALLAEHPRLFVFRSFSKAWGLAGLRVGYAIGGPGSEELLAALEPDLGVSEVSQAGALEAMRACSEQVRRRTRIVCEERVRLTAELRERGFDVSESQANFVWAAHPELDGTELAAGLARGGVIVAVGAALGEPDHVRIALRDAAATDRVLAGLDKEADVPRETP